MKVVIDLLRLSCSSKGPRPLLWGLTALAVLVIPNLLYANEVMTDRCSGDVAIPGAYDQGTEGAMILSRTRAVGGWTPWTQFHQNIDGSGHVRWWCNSTTGNWLDPGAWKIESGSVGAKCSEDGNCTPAVDLSAHPPDYHSGWTAERSRCADHSNVFRARLGPDRLLQIECLGTAGIARSALSARDCSSGPDTCMRGFVWREGNASDHVCVIPGIRTLTREENAAASSHREPRGGAFGPDTCRPGFVWRDAFANDHVCVPVGSRAQAAFDNSKRNERRACH